MQIEMVEIGSLVEDPNNARKHSAKNLEAIKGSLAKFGQQKPIVVDEKGVVLAGNGTLRAAKELGYTKIRVVRTNLKGFDAAAFALADNRTAELAEWDMGVLGQTLSSLKFEEFDIGSIGFEEINNFWSEPEPVESQDQEGEPKVDEAPELYTKKIKAPIYEPKGDKPKVGDLFNLSKTEELFKGIESSSLSSEEKTFLKLAAARHTVFDYGQIAEFYCHVSPEFQSLMEKSALVIIDFDKAIENGFVSMSETIAEAYKDAK